MRTEKLSALFCGLWRDTGGDLDECVRAVYEMGKSDAEAVARKRAHQGTLNERYRIEAQRCAELLRRRWRGLMEAVAERRGTTVDGLLKWKGRTLMERRGTDDLCWLLHERAGLDFMKVAAVIGRHHSSVHAAVGRVRKQIVLNPAYRDELLALVPDTALAVRLAA